MAAHVTRRQKALPINVNKCQNLIKISSSNSFIAYKWLTRTGRGVNWGCDEISVITWLRDCLMDENDSSSENHVTRGTVTNDGPQTSNRLKAVVRGVLVLICLLLTGKELMDRQSLARWSLCWMGQPPLHHPARLYSSNNPPFGQKGSKLCAFDMLLSTTEATKIPTTFFKT